MKFFPLNTLKSCKNAVVLLSLALAGCISEPPFPETIEADTDSAALSKEVQASRQGSVVMDQCGASVGELPGDKLRIAETAKPSCDTVRSRDDIISKADIAGATVTVTFEEGGFIRTAHDGSIVYADGWRQAFPMAPPSEMPGEDKNEGSRGMFCDYIHASFEEQFSLFRSDKNGNYIIQDKEGGAILSENIFATAISVACSDVDSDGYQDVILEELWLAGSGPTWGSTCTVFFNRNGKLVRAREEILVEHTQRGVDARTGTLTWYTHPRFCAVFVGEEQDVSVEEIEYPDGPPSGDYARYAVGGDNPRKIREIWGIRDEKLVLLSKEATPFAEGEKTKLHTP